MQVAGTNPNLSLLHVYLVETYRSHSRACERCHTEHPRWGKVFLVGGKWTCVDCILERLNTDRVEEEE